jgi:hypothetical protein
MPHFLRIDSCSNGIHLAFKPAKLGGVLLVAADEEQRRPKDNHRDGGGDRVLGCLAVLSARGLGGAARYALGLFGQLLAVVGVVLHRRDVARCDFVGVARSGAMPVPGARG